MANHLKVSAERRTPRWLTGCIIALTIALVAIVVIYLTSGGRVATRSLPPSVSSTKAQVNPALPGMTSIPSALATPTPKVTISSTDTKPTTPNLKDEVSSGEEHLTIPGIAFDEKLVPTAIQYDATGSPILPNDVKVHFVTNLTPHGCDVTGGDFIMGHSTIYTNIWGPTPFNAFKTLTPSNIGQPFSIGVHHFVIANLIIQPKEALKTTKEFWCQPPGYVSIVTCYTQDESGDNVIIIGRPE